MLQRLRVIAVLTAVYCCGGAVVGSAVIGSAWAQARHSADDAVALVERAAALLRRDGPATAFAAFDDRQGAFVDGDLYLYVLNAIDGKLTMMAHGANPALIGLPQRGITDADGRDFNGETIRITEHDESGWVTYKWPNPATKKIAVKTSYVRRVGDVIIGAGIYPKP